VSLIPGETHAVRRLLPDSAETTVAEQLATLDFKGMAHPQRPYVLMNFASTADGRATVDGRSGPIGTRTDMEMLQRLRTRVDAVMIGAGTMRVERYGRMVPDPALRAYRERTLLTHDPLGVLVSRGMDLPWDAGLFTDGGGRVVIFTETEEEPPETATPVTVVRHPGGVDLGEALAWLLRERGIKSVLCEGGPTIHGELQAKGLVDELFLTVAPKLAGREERSILNNPLPDVIRMELAWLLESESELFTRYRVFRGLAEQPNA
jgi:riboflavin-specific deaminase-like protein